ncbi:MAG: hypothetical protein JRD05_11340 [Deltaproteobacteria bacterium]|nr:hypothetical protein [Deltaproteobacteria bacterium]
MKIDDCRLKIEGILPITLKDSLPGHSRRRRLEHSDSTNIQSSIVNIQLISDSTNIQYFRRRRINLQLISIAIQQIVNIQ